VLDESEKKRVLDCAEQMGIENPIVDGKLRMVDAHCVFQHDNGLCNIHAEFGFDAKPLICQQYPLIVVDTESGRRAGIDPSCFTHFSSWRTADELPIDAKVANQLSMEPHKVQMEMNVLHALGRPFREVLQIMVLEPEHFGTRLVHMMQAADLEAPIHAPEGGRFLHQYMQALVKHVANLDPENAEITLTGERAAYTVDVAQRMVGLRLLPAYPYIPGVALLTLAGGILADWLYPDNDEAFGATLSTWTRAIRRPAFWGALTPNQNALQMLVGG